jgi:hypothetical protein
MDRNDFNSTSQRAGSWSSRMANATAARKAGGIPTCLRHGCDLGNYRLVISLQRHMAAGPQYESGRF